MIVCFWAKPKTRNRVGKNKKYFQMRFDVLSGDISTVKSDALITAINSGGLWFGGIDGVIQRVAGNMFHGQATAYNSKSGLKQGDIVVAKKTREHRGAFDNVVFVVDDLEAKLHTVVKNGLDAASDAGFQAVTLPTIRMGVMLGQVEKTREEALEEMVKGIRLHQQKGDSKLQLVTLVVYNDHDTAAALRKMLVHERV